MTEAQTTDAPAIVLLPSDRFFVRTVPLAAGADAAAQVMLALETLAPFPVEQLYHGYVVSPAGDAALVFAAYRKRFAIAEAAAWPAAEAVLPSFLALLGAAPAQPLVRVWSEARGLTAVAWDGKGTLPVAVLARETDGPAAAAARQALVAEIRARTGLAKAALQEVTGTAAATFSAGRESFTLALGDGAGAMTSVLSREQADRADVRDKTFLTGRRAALRRDILLWRGFLGCLIGLAAMIVFELGIFGGGIWVSRIRAALREHTAEVQKIETAQALSTRIEELTEQRLLPFEMLAVVNQNRPVSVQFSRTFSTGMYSLEIQAQTPNAADVSQYEAVLRAAQGIDSVETRDLRARDGLTTFTLSVTFKPAALQPGVGT